MCGASSVLSLRSQICQSSHSPGWQEKWTIHLLKVLSGRRGPEGVVEAQAITRVAGVGVGAVRAVPGVVAVDPREVHGEGGEEVV